MGGCSAKTAKLERKSSRLSGIEERTALHDVHLRGKGSLQLLPQVRPEWIALEETASSSMRSKTPDANELLKMMKEDEGLQREVAELVAKRKAGHQPLLGGSRPPQV